jgi:hypothetical protein
MNKIGKNANVLIPSLISLFKDYNNNLRIRLKADTLFLSFDDRSKKLFNKFINLSNDRFKLMKSGGKLNHILLRQKQNYSKLNDDIQDDLLFNTNYSIAERKKLSKSVNIFKSKEIFNVRDKLFETLKQRTTIDNMLREKQILERKAKIEEQKQKYLKQFSSRSNTSKSIKEENKKQLSENKIKHATETLEEDQNNFMTAVNTYKNLLQEKKMGFKENKEPKSVYNNRFIKISKNEFSDIETKINENNIKILSYSEENLGDKKIKKNEDERFDINSLYKIKNSIGNMNPVRTKKNQKLDIFPKLNVNIEEKNYDLPFLIDKNDNNDIRSQTFHNKDMKNTINIIRKEAYNGVMLGEKFQNQKRKFDTFYYRHFPKYNYTKFENNMKQKKFQRLKEEIVKRGKTPKFTRKRKMSNYERILEYFNKIYVNKKEIWKKEDEEKETRKKNNEKKEAEIIDFLLNLGDRSKNNKPSE